eukprot:8320077-Alexandrium_andersonii.AAC.1
MNIFDARCRSTACPSPCAWRSPTPLPARSCPLAASTGSSRPGALLPAVGCPAPPCLLAPPWFRVVVVRWRWQWRA